MGHNILSNCVAQEGMNVHQSFQLLQEIIGAERLVIYVYTANMNRAATNLSRYHTFNKYLAMI